MHESTRRLICRALFVFLCALPTLLMLGWVVARWLPGTEAAYAARASAALGIAVRIGKVEFPTPGQTLFRDVELADPESGRLLARVRALETATRDGTPVWLASQPEIEPGGLARLARALDERFLRGNGGDWPALEFAAGEATLKDDASARWLTLSDVAARLESREEGPRARLEFRVAGMQLASPLTLEIGRNRQTNPPQSDARFDTAGSAIPTALLAHWIPELAVLGDNCRVRGSIWLVAAADGWEGDAALELSELDLDRLTRDRFPHRLSGTGRLSRCEAKLHGGRIVTASGQLVAGPGSIDRGLVDAARDALRIETPRPAGAGPASPTTSSQKTLYYRELACDFRLGDEGLRLTGACEEAGPGVLLADARGPLLAEPSAAVQPLPAVALVRMLAPASVVQVPATRETDLLLRLLPLPPLVSPEPLSPRPPTARVTLPEESGPR